MQVLFTGASLLYMYSCQSLNCSCKGGNKNNDSFNDNVLSRSINKCR